ncbi:MAG: hypothetical protein LBS53_06845 [Synergistaceae bacterium]|nr:hypothetical protein [Synergistaceae bacterium]
MKSLKALFWMMFVFAIFFPGMAFAHPPREVRLDLRPGGELVVYAAHTVDDPQKHYIYRITVYANNNIVATRDYKSQNGMDGLTDAFAVGDLPSGTNLKAEAFCVIMGSATGTVVVP